MSGPTPLNRSRILAVFAHPDDESLACGGTLIRAVDAGALVTVVSVTDGGLGATNPQRRSGSMALSSVRRAEMAAAAAVLGVPDARVWNYPDGQFPWLDPSALAHDLSSLLAELVPNAVITFGADGLYWHPDHIHVHEQVTKAAAEARPSPPLYYVTMRTGALAAAIRETCARHAEAEEHPWGLPAEAFGSAARPPELQVDVGDVISRKMAALRCHASQFGPTNPLWLMDDDVARAHLGWEWFHLEPSSAARSEAFERLGHLIGSAKALASPPNG